MNVFCIMQFSVTIVKNEDEFTSLIVMNLNIIYTLPVLIITIYSAIIVTSSNSLSKYQLLNLNHQLGCNKHISNYTEK